MATSNAGRFSRLLEELEESRRQEHIEDLLDRLVNNNGRNCQNARGCSPDVIELLGNLLDTSAKVNERMNPSGLRELLLLIEERYGTATNVSRSLKDLLLHDRGRIEEDSYMRRERIAHQLLRSIDRGHEGGQNVSRKTLSRMGRKDDLMDDLETLLQILAGRGGRRGEVRTNLSRTQVESLLEVLEERHENIEERKMLESLIESCSRDRLYRDRTSTVQAIFKNVLHYLADNLESAKRELDILSVLMEQQPTRSIGRRSYGLIHALQEHLKSLDVAARRRVEELDVVQAILHLARTDELENDELDVVVLRLLRKYISEKIEHKIKTTRATHFCEKTEPATYTATSSTKNIVECAKTAIGCESSAISCDFDICDSGKTSFIADCRSECSSGNNVECEKKGNDCGVKGKDCQ